MGHPIELLPDRRVDPRVTVSANVAPQAAHTVDVPIAIHVVEVRALTSIHNNWFTSYHPKGPSRTIHSTRHKLLGALEETMACSAFHVVLDVVVRLRIKGEIP